MTTTLFPHTTHAAPGTTPAPTREDSTATPATGTTNTMLSPHLKHLEDEAIHIIREVAGQSDNTALLFSGGKDSVLVYELARRAFHPNPVPFELLHIDTGHNFDEVISFRDNLAARTGARLHVAHVQDWIDDGRVRDTPGGSRNTLQTRPLVDTIAARGYTAVLGGARRDEERARSKERIFSVRDSFGGWDPRRQRPELWQLYNAAAPHGDNVRVFPISNFTELDVWEYIHARNIELPSIYYAHTRTVFNRDGMWLSPGPWGGPRDNETLETRMVRYRTVGDMSCTGAIDSTATTTKDIIEELLATTVTERGATRADDRASDNAMEDRKKEGYF